MNPQELFERHHANNAGFCRHYLTLYSIVLGLETKSAFEFGSGFSSKTILMALEKTGGKLITCDQRPLEQTAIFYDKNEIKNYSNWTYINKKSIDIFKDIEGKIFDFVLHDGAHDVKTVKQDLKLIMPKMKKNGILLLHDTEHPAYNLKEAIPEDKISKVTLPFGFGLTIIKIEEDFGNGTIDIRWKKE